VRQVLALLLALLLPQAAGAVACRNDSFEGAAFTLCEVEAGEDLRLFLNGADGPYGSFAAVNDALAAEGGTLAFAMNAGMYHRDLSPVGLFVAEGREAARLVTREGPGNFGLLPNGVFCWGDGRFRIVESRTFRATAPDCRFATQSGPMLVIGGALHPRFLPDSDSLHIRNGVGVSRDGRRAVFVISGDAVNFHRFGRYFRDRLGLPEALYLDGSISRLYAPALGRNDIGFPMGPIVGVVVPKG
jgi:uncharacterized protein YigE (DUF2233 family)